ncbi:hypothetical protein [Rhodocista pekingensis]|uniref:Uncharacterized protein n=1 Tax=Rhodocista pekingensis TaxID=201185 RepID=A0ABW2L271_9PROT
MDVDTLPPDLRQRLRTAFDNLADLLDEETGRVARADAEELKLYTEAKQALFEQLGILLKEANRPQPPVLPGPVVETGGVAAELAEGAATGAESAEETTAATPDGGGEETSAPPVDDPVAVRAAATRLRGAVETNRRAIRAAQDAVSAVARHIAGAIERSRSDGVYGRSGQARRAVTTSFARVEREL